MPPPEETPDNEEEEKKSEKPVEVISGFHESYPQKEQMQVTLPSPQEVIDSQKKEEQEAEFEKQV